MTKRENAALCFNCGYAEQVHMAGNKCPASVILTFAGKPTVTIDAGLLDELVERYETTVRCLEDVYFERDGDKHEEAEDWALLARVRAAREGE